MDIRRGLRARVAKTRLLPEHAEAGCDGHVAHTWSGRKRTPSGNEILEFDP
jgi:hypothetical protein